MQTTSRQTEAPSGTTSGDGSLSESAFWFLAVVVAVQGGHVVEHIVQLIQVVVLDVPDKDALGLLGYVLQFNGTEEWLHLGFNSLYLACLYALILPLWRGTPRAPPPWSFPLFLFRRVWLQTWDVLQHRGITPPPVADSRRP